MRVDSSSRLSQVNVKETSGHTAKGIPDVSQLRVCHLGCPQSRWRFMLGRGAKEVYLGKVGALL